MQSRLIYKWTDQEELEEELPYAVRASWYFWHMELKPVKPGPELGWPYPLPTHWSKVRCRMLRIRSLGRGQEAVCLGCCARGAVAVVRLLLAESVGCRALRPLAPGDAYVLPARRADAG